MTDPTQPMPGQPYPPTTPYGPPPQPVPPAAKVKQPPKMVRRRTLIWTAAGTGLVGLLIGTAGNNPPPQKTAAAAEPLPAVTVTVTETKTIEPVAPATTQAAPPPAQQAQPATPEIGDGTWEVGKDLPPGTYVANATESFCYLDVKRGDNYVAQHVGAGHWRVQLQTGQVLTSQRCGTWQKAG